MSTRRTSANSGFVNPSRLPKGPNGRALCRQCGTEVPKGRRTFCGNDCVDRWKIKTDPRYVRYLVLQRDHGICAICGLDTEELLKVLRRVTQSREIWTRFPDRRHPVMVAIQGLKVRGTSLWDADHIVPVVEGGGECDLDNYRTLCCWCHRQVTAELAGRRAERRKAEQAASQGQLGLEGGR